MALLRIMTVRKLVIMDSRDRLEILSLGDFHLVSSKGPRFFRF